MTTSVIIVSPDDTANNLLVYVEGDGARTEPVVLKPGDQAKPISITGAQRIVIEEAARDDRDAPAPKA